MESVQKKDGGASNEVHILYMHIHFAMYIAQHLLQMERIRIYARICVKCVHRCF